MRTALVISALLIGLASGSEWSDSYLAKIEEMGDPPSSEEIALLAVLASNEVPKEEVQLVRAEAWKVLRNSDGFPDALFARIEEFRKEWKRTGISNSYDFERLKILSSMGELQDVRVVDRLGSLLHDMEWSEDPVEHMAKGADYGLTQPNGKLSAQALANLVENPPLKKDPESYLESDIEPWRLWYEQLKAGNRTFRFKGDPQEYSLTGPVAQSLEPKSVSPPEISEGSSESVEETRPSIWPLAFAVLLLVVAIRFASRRKPASP
ncbi:hypothetical protein OKA04_20900 [Luteolibacter flavescens]|uniref:Uncharacterized protein n=1 Tax=Luteolibacter flavescens TaxID=1859460 RepID=A0ABT3FUE7_9BACT|nr:hypothetical protein [Luteolibacter flavescens]MCW1887210.1 hypothetical protein [Luteolibacter flavescens]